MGPKGQAVDGSGWVISFTLSFGLENSTQIKFDKEEEYQRALDSLNEKFNVWCTYPEGFSLEDLMRQCYDNFFKSWHEEYEHWADDEDTIREELHHNQYEG